MSAASPRAELIADRGEAAGDEEFFRSPQFLEAEGVTHTLRIESDRGELLAPLIVREIPPPTGPKVGNSAALGPVGGQFDAISPYGYPGFASASDFDHPRGGSMSDGLDPSSVDFSPTGLVSVFIRHALGASPLRGAHERNVVQIADPALPAKSRGSDRNRINRNLRRGYAVRIVPGLETTPAERAEFHAAYEQTMRRAGAAERYFFGAPYFDRLLESPQTWLALAHSPDGDVAAASLVTRSDGFLHYYLSGSADAHLRDSPMKNVVAALLELAREQGLPLNLGGGLSRGDPLEEFKRGFANREQAWLTSEIVCDERAYARLSAPPPHRPTAFFPAYRAQSAASGPGRGSDPS